MTDSNFGPADMLAMLRDKARLWLIPTVLMTLVAIGYVLVKPSYWEASQALIVRHEAAGSDSGDGSFADVSQMKTLQETMLELIKSRRVLTAALKAVGPPTDRGAGSSWPSDQELADLREDLKMVPPKGAEFGSTEVFYLKVQARPRTRAVALVDALCQALEERYQALRDTKARSLYGELSRAESLAAAQLKAATDRLVTFEKGVGADLAELRVLQASPSGGSDIRQELVTMENELRRAQADQQRNEQLLSMLVAASHDPNRLVATPNSLLTAQPALRRLKEGLVDTQLRSARLAGTMTARHPLLRAARDAEAATRSNLHQELDVAIRGLRVDLRLNADRVATLERQLTEHRQQLAHLAGMRAKYANLIATFDNRTQLLETARRRVAETRAREAAAETTSLIAKIDAPEGGIHPVGPGKAVIVLAGTVGGLIIGLGLVFLVTTPSIPGSATTEAPVRGSTGEAASGTSVRTSTPRNPSFGRALKTLAARSPGSNGTPGHARRQPPTAPR